MSAALTRSIGGKKITEDVLENAGAKEFLQKLKDHYLIRTCVPVHIHDIQDASKEYEARGEIPGHAQDIAESIDKDGSVTYPPLSVWVFWDGNLDERKCCDRHPC